jgi:hypothetical protein
VRERFMLYLGVSEVVQHEQVAEFCTECGGGGDAVVCFGNLVSAVLFVEKLHERNAWTSRSSTQHARTATENNQLMTLPVFVFPYLETQDGLGLKIWKFTLVLQSVDGCICTLVAVGRRHCRHCAHARPSL